MLFGAKGDAPILADTTEWHRNARGKCQRELLACEEPNKLQCPLGGMVQLPLGRIPTVESTWPSLATQFNVCFDMLVLIQESMILKESWLQN